MTIGRGWRRSPWSGATSAVLAGLRPDPQRLIAGLAAPHAWFAAGRGRRRSRRRWPRACSGWWPRGWPWACWSPPPATCPAWPARWPTGCAALVLPRLVRNLLAGGAGLGVLLAPVAAGAAGPAHAGPATPVPLGPARPPSPRPGGRSRRRVDPRPHPALALDAGHQRPTPGPGGAHRPPAAPVPPSHRAPPGVTVAPGDSLWLIAARRLGPHPGAARDRRLVAALVRGQPGRHRRRPRPDHPRPGAARAGRVHNEEART